MNHEHAKLALTVLQELKTNGRIVQYRTPYLLIEETRKNAGTPRNYLGMGCWKDETDCGTVACLGGWLCQDERVKATGLIMARGGVEYGDAVFYEPSYEGSTGHGALERWLGITHSEGIHIFGPGNPNHFGKGVERLEEIITTYEERT